MCTHQKIIFPKYSKRPMYVKCGHCPACLQEKAANRVRRIKDTASEDMQCFIVTLTYSAGCSPYILRSDAYDFLHGKKAFMPIYRDCSKRRVRTKQNGKDHVYKIATKKELVLLDVIEDIDEHDENLTLSNTKDLKHEPGKIGVCYYKDYQHFVAKLRLNLKRIYRYYGKIYVYACSEYGCKSLRPHFHLLVFIENAGAPFLRNAVVKSWLFSDISRFKRAVERCFNAASYVASYVNQSSDFPLFFKTFAKTKHSYSKGFGLNNKEYSLSSILSKLERGYLAYNHCRQTGGLYRVSPLPLPKRVINRYFPVFKTSTRCSPCSLYAYLDRIMRYEYDTHTVVDSDNVLFPDFTYSLSHENLYLAHDELLKISVRLNNAYRRFQAFAPDGVDISRPAYIKTYIAVWRAYNSTILRLSMENEDVPFLEKYDNWDAVKYKHKYEGLNVVGVTSYDMEEDPNKFLSVRWNTAHFEQSYHDHIKHRNVRNSVYLAEDANCEL